MDFDELRRIENEAARVAATYEIFNEDVRLNRSKAARVEFLTSVRCIEGYLRGGCRILDLGAGAGAYSLHFAQKGHEVTALELAPANIAAFRRKLALFGSPPPITLIEGNALDLSAFADESFDIVLVFGPLYHLAGAADRARCIREALRVCKKEGTLFFSFIANDMVIPTEFACRPDFFADDTYDHETFKVHDFPFVFFTLDQCRQMLRDAGITITREVAADGVSELMAEQINTLSDKDFAQYLRYHFYCCEKPEMLGHSNHLLFAGKKA